MNTSTTLPRHLARATTKSPHFEQSISGDGGKSWELTWVTDQIKGKP